MLIKKNTNNMNLKYNFLKLQRQAADLNSQGQAEVWGKFWCQLPSPLFTVLGCGPAIKSA